MSDLAHARLVVSRAALLSEREAARLIGGRDALDWLREAFSPQPIAATGSGDVLPFRKEDT